MSAKCTGFSTILIAACLLLLPGCSTVQGLVASTVVGRAPAELRQECPPLQPLPLNPPPLLGDLAEQISTDAGAYAECARRVRGWIEWERGVLSGERR